MKRTVRGYIKYISLRNIIFPIIVLVLMGALLYLFPFRNILLPAQASSPEQISRAAAGGEEYLSVSVDDLTYTGYDYVSGGKTAASYYYILLDGELSTRCYFFLLPAKATNGAAPEIAHYEGRATILHGDEYFNNFLTDFAADIGWSRDGLSDACGGYLVSPYHYRPALPAVIVALILIVSLYSMIYILSNLVKAARPELHETSRRLARFGLDSEDFSDIDRELANDTIIRAGDLYVTDHYLVGFHARSIYIVPLFNIVWAYKYCTLNKFSRSKRLSYTLVIVTSPRDKITIPGNHKEDANEILRFLARDFSHITVGYTEAIRKKMEKLNLT